jgi:transcriptional activator SPT7
MSMLTLLVTKTTVEVPDDGDLFGDQEDEEEDGAYVMYDPSPFSPPHLLIVIDRGGFAEAFGEDFLGLRELGIASEFGLTSLSVPKKLLKGKNKGKDNLPSAM